MARSEVDRSTSRQRSLAELFSFHSAAALPKLTTADLTPIALINHSVKPNPNRSSKPANLVQYRTAALAISVIWERLYRMPQATDAVVNATSIALRPHRLFQPYLSERFTIMMSLIPAMPGLVQTSLLVFTNRHRERARRVTTFVQYKSGDTAIL